MLVAGQGVLSEELDGEFLLLVPPHQVLVLDPVASAVWRLLPGTEPDLVGQLAAAFGADPAVVAADVAALTSDLVDRGALERQ